jgi:hypothetical protein
MVRTLIVAVATVAVVAAGCGGGGGTSVAEYEDAVVTTRERVDSSLERVTQAQSLDDLLERMDQAAIAIEAGADDVDQTGSPEKFEDETKRLVTGLRQLSTDLEATAAQIRQPGFEELLTGLRGLNFESWTKVNRVLGELREQGIDVQPLARH